MMLERPAGWYRNPKDQRGVGYWDGTIWVAPRDVEPPAEELETPAGPDQQQ